MKNEKKLNGLERASSLTQDCVIANFNYFLPYYILCSKAVWKNDLLAF